MAPRAGALALLLALAACDDAAHVPGTSPITDTSGPDASSDARPEAGLDAQPEVGLDAAALDATDADAAPAPLRVLFIGNSYTYVNDLPGMLTSIAASAGTSPTIATDEVVQGGATLSDHWDAGAAQARINERTWSHVVLQGQSLEPTYPGTGFAEPAVAFGQLAADAGARPTLFVTWARAPNDPSYNSYDMLNADEMQDVLTGAYAGVAKQLPGSILSCVGEAFRTSLHDHPDIVLHQTDFSHPTVAGTYLAACTFYVALTGVPVPAASAVPPGVSSDDAELLRAVAMVGTNCADVHPKGVVRWLNTQCPVDLGTLGIAIPYMLEVTNTGYGPAIVNDGLSLKAPFAWTSGAFPGGDGTVTINGMQMPFCSGPLTPGGNCAMSVTYTPSTAATSTVTLALDDSYIPSLACELSAAPATRALITISESAEFFGPSDANGPAWIWGAVGSTASASFLVSNRGALPVTSLGEGTPMQPPFYWGPDGAGGSFPGGSGAGTVGNVQYDYCASSLDPGERCMVTVSFAAIDLVNVEGAINLAYADAQGPISPNANRNVHGKFASPPP
jgi:hypothetical protein